MRTGLIVLWMLLCSITSAAAQVSVSIGIDLPVYPQLVVVPGYPVYYAPQVNSNYFFYDGMYWVYAADNWYASSWYNGPWELVDPEAVPLFVLRVPVRYYRRPPAYFNGWRAEASPRWGDHWGNAWVQQHGGWDTWNRSAVPAPAPLPVYQRQYSGNRYPRAEQQQALQTQNYRYQPHDPVVQQHYQAPRAQSAPAPTPQATRAMPQEKVVSKPQDQRGSRPQSSVQQNAAPVPQGQPRQNGGQDVQRAATAHAPPKQGGPTAQPQGQQPQQAAVQREQKAATSRAQDQGPQAKGPAQEPRAAQDKPQPQQAAVAREQKATRSRAQDQGPQAKGPAQEPRAAQDKPQPQQAADPHQQQAPRAQGQDKGQGKEPAQEPKQGQEKARDKVSSAAGNATS